MAPTPSRFVSDSMPLIILCGWIDLRITASLSPVRASSEASQTGQTDKFHGDSSDQEGLFRVNSLYQTQTMPCLDRGGSSRVIPQTNVAHAAPKSVNDFQTLLLSPLLKPRFFSPLKRLLRKSRSRKYEAGCYLFTGWLACILALGMGMKGPIPGY
jgi:hypothetical protein